MNASLSPRHGGMYPHEGTRDAFRCLSREFLQLVMSYLRKDNSDTTRQAIALWCKGQPRWYQDYVRSRLGVETMRLHPASEATTAQAVSTLARTLPQKDVTCLFLLNDGLPLAEAYENVGGTANLVRFGRRTFLRKRRLMYFCLFSLVNKAALRTADAWPAFLWQYRTELRKLLRDDLGQIFERALSDLPGLPLDRLSAKLRQGGRLVVVDSGMQGTFALPLATWISTRFEIPFEMIDIRLLVAYPWLAKLFGERCVTTDTSVLLRVEQSVRDRRLSTGAPSSNPTPDLQSMPSAESRTTKARRSSRLAA